MRGSDYRRQADRTDPSTCLIAYRTWSVEAFFHEDGYISEAAFAKEVNRLIQVGRGRQEGNEL